MDLNININEDVALIISVLIGTVGYIAFLVYKYTKTIN